MGNLSGWTFWRCIPLRAQLMIGFIVPVILISISSLVVYRGLNETEAKSTLVEQSLMSIALQNMLLNAVLEAETGERGFVITGKSEFLQPYHQALGNFTDAATRLKNLRPDEVAEIAQIEDLFNRWLNEVAKPVISRRQQSPGRLDSYGGNALYHLKNVNTLLSEAGTVSEELATELAEFLRLIKEAAGLSMTTDSAPGWAELLALSEQLRQRMTATAFSNDQVIPVIEQIEGKLNELTHQALENEYQAIKIISSGTGKKLIDEIRANVYLKIDNEEEKLQQLSTESRELMSNAGQLSLILPVISLIVGMLLILLMQAGMLRSIAALRKGAHYITLGQLDTRVANTRSDELGDLTLSFNQMAAQLQKVRQEVQALESLQSTLASSQTVAEAYEAAARVCQRLLSQIDGAFYAMAASRNLTEMVSYWGDATNHNSLFAPKECRALRTGRMHTASENSVEVFCQHTVVNVKASACIPLASGDETLGMMLLTVSNDNNASDITEQETQLALTIADMLSLALSNIRLTEKLHAQSIRDPLTGLFNRRYLEETMERELARSVRQAKPLSVVALDADYFKKFNDQFGHDAGDKVLKEIAEQMRQVVRPSDLACRLGGEEFLLVMPDADTSIAVQRAEDLRTRIASVALHYQGRSLGHITVSLGVATAPTHAQSASELMQKADSALYLAKHSGRNRVEVATAFFASS